MIVWIKAIEDAAVSSHIHTYIRFIYMYVHSTNVHTLNTVYVKSFEGENFCGSSLKFNM